MKKILLQLDTDALPSSFDRVVAVDAGVDELFSYGGVTPENVNGLVHGAIFTRGPADLKHTAIFAGGSDVARGEALTKAVTAAFFGPMKVSVMMDSNGCNTTAAAAVACVRRHVSLSEVSAVVLGATGPVGLRAAELLAVEGARVTMVSRTSAKAAAAADVIREKVPGAELTPCAAAASAEVLAACEGHHVLVAAGAAGVCFLEQGQLAALAALQVAVDLNAVPPLGIADVGAMDKGKEIHGIPCYGALGVGGLKMKVHKQAISTLFKSNEHCLQTRELYELALQIDAAARS
jgi:hypothetical protein